MKVALTFDAEHPSRRHCPPGIQEALLQELEVSGIRATFFIQGRWAKAYPETARAIVAAGHLVGNHSHYHARMSLLSDEGLRTDISSGGDAIREITGVDTRPWFRCPFGDGADDPRVLGALKELGYRDVSWDVDAADWDADRSPWTVEADLLDGVAAGDEEVVVLLHTWPATTLEILPRIVGHLRGRGAEFVALDGLERFAQI